MAPSTGVRAAPGCARSAAGGGRAARVCPRQGAPKKAFITTRVGDVGLLIGIILLWKATGPFNIQEISEAAEAGTIGPRRG